MMKRLILAILLFVSPVCCWSGPLQYLHGQVGRYGETGGGGIEITGQTEVIATYGESITAGDPVTIRQVRMDDYTGTATPTFLGLAKCGALSPSLSGIGITAAISPCGRILGIGSTGAPYLATYFCEFDSELATYTFSNIAISGGTPSNNPYSIKFSPNGDIMAVGHYKWPYLTNYRIKYSEELATYTVTKMSGVTGGMPPSDGIGVAFSPNGEILAIATAGSPYIATYRILYDSYSDDYFISKNSSVTGGSPAGVARSVAFSPNGEIMAVGHDGSPYVTIYEVEEVDGVYSFTKTTGLTGGNPTGSGWNVKFSPNGQILSVAHTNSPYMTNYRVTNDEAYAFTKMEVVIIGGAPSGNGLGLAFNLDGNMLAINHSTFPYFSLYEIAYDSASDEYSFTQLGVPALASIWSYCESDFSPDGRLLAIPSGFAIFHTHWAPIIDELRAFKANAECFDNIMLLNQVHSFGYAMETGIASDSRKVMKLFDLR